MSARPRAGSLRSDEADACMKPALVFFVLGSLSAPLTVLIVDIGMTWEIMEINIKMRERVLHIDFS